MGRSSVLPLVGFPHGAEPGSIWARRWTGAVPAADAPQVHGVHTHDFLMLLYVVRGRWTRHVDGRDWTVAEGEAFVIAPGAAIDADEPDPHPDPEREMWAVLFPSEAVDPGAAAALASWRGHPLLSPFVGSHRGGGQRLAVPSADRPAWLARLAALEEELATRRDGYVDAARAHLTLLLVALGRLQDDVPAEATDPQLAAVFAVIEDRFRDPISLRDVASALSLTPGHLTTVVGRGTGRTVQQWITERRMREARRLLVDTDLAVADVATRVGYRDPGYFIRRFRAAHRTSPASWRGR